MGIMEWHKEYTKWGQRKLGMSDYAFLWLSLLKGVAYGVAVTPLIVRAIR